MGIYAYGQNNDGGANDFASVCRSPKQNGWQAIMTHKRQHCKILVAILALAGYIAAGAIHELGHACAAIWVGGQVISIQPWVMMGTIHCNLANIGAGFPMAVVAMAGMLTTVLVGIAGSLAVTLCAARFHFSKIGVWLFMPMLCQSLAWLIFPLFLSRGLLQPNDDIVQFTHQSGWPPFAVMSIGFVLVALNGGLLIWICRKKTGKTERTRPGAIEPE